ncbi:hypothetical protein D3OALGB2SA_1199 [Olavius algarvensis associated proteobacterium Delta 3]|nr:hypothetical protein D3OALGB2SA_1199 [Olavius algarvensis associated proteobacterium Delta 3]
MLDTGYWMQGIWGYVVDLSFKIVDGVTQRQIPNTKYLNTGQRADGPTGQRAKPANRQTGKPANRPTGKPANGLTPSRSRLAFSFPIS